MEISVVIITKNEGKNIADCIRSASQVSRDIIVVDSGSADNTVTAATSHGARTVCVVWTGFGNSRNAGAAIAKHDWILALDADERITEELAGFINKLNLKNPLVVYGFKRQSYLVDKKIRFGDWGRDKVFRIYCRKATQWNLFPVHESLVIDHKKRKIIKGKLVHFKSPDPYKQKLIRYAKLCAQKYCLLGRKASLINMVFSPLFSFVNGYFLRFGFLDGKEGFDIAKSIAYYTWLKYYYLLQLSKPVNFFYAEKEYSNLQ
jgi:glycosyltransferase involved in cell wall biosynthesis